PTLNCPPRMPTLSVALAETVTVPAIEAPATGAVMETAGGVVSGTGLLTVTFTAAVVAELPAASLATALTLWLPFALTVVFQDIEYGAVVTSAPRFTPSSLNCTPTMPTLSMALAETVTVPATEAPATGAVMETAGGVVSGTRLLTLTLTAAEVAELPAASRATALTLWLPFALAVVFQD